MKTKVINKDSFFLMRWFIKWYIWVWRPNLSTLTDCKLFWGTLFSPLAFLNGKKEFKIVPRISFFYIFVSLFFLVVGMPGTAIGLFISALLIIPIFLIIDFFWFRKKSTESVSADIAEEDDKEEEFECPRLEAFLEKFFNSRPGEIIFDMICGIIDLKERKCSFIKIE